MESQTQNTENTPKVIETPKAAATPKPKKPKAVKIETSPIKAGVSRDSFKSYPELLAMVERLSKKGIVNFKLDFGYSTKAARTGKRNHVTEIKYNLPSNLPIKTGKYNAEDKETKEIVNGKNHKITGKSFFKLFPEVGKLFIRLAAEFFPTEKTSGSPSTAGEVINARFNFGFSTAAQPAKRREHIIKADAPQTAEWQD